MSHLSKTVRGMRLWTAVLFLFAQGLVWAQSPTPKAAASPAATPEADPGSTGLKALKIKLAAAQAELTQIVGPSPEGSSEAPGAPGDGGMEAREYLSQIVRAYTRQIASIGSMEGELQRKADLEREAAAWKGFPNPPPFAIRMVDELRDSLQSVQQYAHTVKFTTALVNNALADSRNNLSQSETKLRQVNEKLEELAKNPAALAQVTAQRDLLQLGIRSYNAQIEMLEGECKLWSVKQDCLNIQAELLQRQIAIAEKSAKFTQAELDKINAGLLLQLRKLDKELQRIIADAQPAQKALAEARQNLLTSSTAQAAPPEDGAVKLANLQELVEVRRIQMETIALREELLQQLQQLTTTEKNAWQYRFNAFAREPRKMEDARQKINASIERCRVLREYYHEQAGVNSRQLTDLESYVRNTSSAPAASLRVAQDKIDSFRLRDESYKRLLQAIEKLERQTQRWSGEIGESKTAPMAPKMRVAGWYDGFGNLISHWWNHEFYKVVDPGFPGGLRPITVAKMVTALGILLVGYFICRLLARQMQEFLTRRVHVESNMAAIIRGWMMFFLCLGLVMIAMNWVKIPLTAFAFLGGALAIGIGFGTQNLLKNFISGIMLLVEQPLRLGDFVEVGASRGRVVSIGIRSSVIRNSDGIETLIPNSAFLEGNVTNWTYSSPQVRFKIRVGVAFLSSTREVSEILAEVVAAHGQVFATPKPQVLLEEFAEKGMVFAIYYWLEPLKCDSAAISSDLRFMIERRLTEAGITMT